MSTPKRNKKPRTAARTVKKRTKRRRSARSGPAPAAEHIEVIARGVLMHGSRVLLCRSLERGYLYLPGGHVEIGESAARAAAREFLEECGLVVRVGELVLVSEGVFSSGRRRHHEINLVFHVEHTPRRANGGADGPPPAVVSREPQIAFEWVDLLAVVDLDVRPAAARAWLASGGGEGAQWVSEVG